MVVTGAFLVSRVLGWLRVLVLGNLFGTPEQIADLDAYYAAFRIPDLTFELVAAGAIASALIPVLSGLIANGQQDRAWRVASSVINLMLAALLTFAVVFAILAPSIVPLLVPGFDEETTQLTIELTRLMLIAPIFLATGSIVSAILQTQDRFGVAALAPVIYNAAIIGGALLLSPALGIYGVALGVVIGAIGHLLIQLPALRGRFTYSLRADVSDPAARETFWLMLPRAIGMGANQITFLVNTALASTVAVGAVVSYTVAFSVLQIPLGVIGLPLGIVLLPSMSRALATGRELEFTTLVTRALRLLLWMMAFVAAVGIVARDEVVDLLFGWGFDESALAATAAALGDLPAGTARARHERHPRSGLLQRQGHHHAGQRGDRLGGCERGHLCRHRRRPRYQRPGAGHRPRRLVRGHHLDHPAAATSHRDRHYGHPERRRAVAGWGRAGGPAGGWRASPRRGPVRPATRTGAGDRAGPRHECRTGGVRPVQSARATARAPPLTRPGARGDAGPMSAAQDAVRIVGDAASAPDGWHERAVAVRGGHVLQSATWGGYRAGQGYEPRYLTFEDERVALALLRRTQGLPGVEASVRRGPAQADDSGRVAAARAAALSAWARDHAARDLYLDPELAADVEYSGAMQAAGFSPTEGMEPSIHVMRLDFAPGADRESVRAGFSKSTRQRIRAAERDGTSVSEDSTGAHLEAFAALMRERAEVVGMQLQQGTDFLRGWRALMAGGLARLLVAEHEGELVGGLFLFRHGGIHATAYSADRATRRSDLPGTMHLVRAIAIDDALSEGCHAIELGGVDLPGHRSPPQPGDPNRGLYEHKRGFGATWVQREPAHRIVLRPGAERLARVRRRTIDGLRGMRR